MQSVIRILNVVNMLAKIIVMVVFLIIESTIISLIHFVGRCFTAFAEKLSSLLYIIVDSWRTEQWPL